MKLHDEFTQCIPVDEDDGFYYRDWNTVQDPRMVAPRILSPSTTPKELAGYYIHSRCWELLSHHELRTVAERDMNTLRLALRTKYTQTGYQPKCWNPDASQEGQSSPVRPLLHRPLMSLTLGHVPDPVRTKRVSDAISSALKQGRRRKTTKKKKKGKRQPAPQKARVGSCNLPLELLYMIFDYLPSQTVAFIEKELGVSMGNMYWRSRISTEFFYEIVGVDDERIDWKQLCLKLERQLATSTALVIRRYLLECMDDIMEIVRRSRSYTKWAGQQCKDK